MSYENVQVCVTVVLYKWAPLCPSPSNKYCSYFGNLVSIVPSITPIIWLRLDRRCAVSPINISEYPCFVLLLFLFYKNIPFFSLCRWLMETMSGIWRWLSVSSASLSLPHISCKRTVKIQGPRFRLNFVKDTCTSGPVLLTRSRSS